MTQSSKPQIQSHESNVKFRRRKKSSDRWWRISDDKIKEARTSDVLGMQREVYLLFYELERPGDENL
jgi:ubiquitin carboxyl-terminal hydrolase 16